MSTVLFTLPELYHSYKSWVSKNPSSLGDWESSVKWISYFLAGRINNSHVVSELIYCLSNLLVMFNDRIIKKAQKVHSNSTAETIKLWLTVIEYSEVFCELSANRIWGNTGKWIVIVSIQVFKCISRLFLIFHYKEPIIQSPPIPVLNRKNVAASNQKYISARDVAQSEFDSVSFTLKRSGRVVRKVDSSPPLGLRDWKPLPKMSLMGVEEGQTLNNALAKRELIAETVYISKPIIHLAAMACLGTNTWKPWAVSLALDFASLELYRSCTKKDVKSVTPQQRLQISKRTILLLLYLLRSPMYEKHSKDRVHSFLMTLSKVPLAGLIFTPLAQYLPFWQSTYFYMWSS
ncbi:peroxisomal membrane protein PEX16 [Diabrotica virgifera virgifera]|uniref:Peroxisomal membrane protein PEX16 n=1 Tax=Diabrotica virgifera virgifera TaxID=50390 RepID=A0A6P7GQ95_DIAVI|nr:peroxisomal membrane protein PEX16 [Diabrotica virgifera virgifera]